MGVSLMISFIPIILLNTVLAKNEGKEVFTIEMPGASPKVNNLIEFKVNIIIHYTFLDLKTSDHYTISDDDAYYCTAYKMVNQSFLVNFDVHSSMNVAHHILVYGCPTPFFLNMNIWECNGANICGNYVSPKIIYAWARNASNFTYPPNVGYEVGPNANISYLLMQIHYLSALPSDHEDRSSISISHTSKEPPNKAGIYLMMAYGQVIMPKKLVYHVDMACVYTGPDLHPFAFRTHAHSLGRVVSGFVVKKSGASKSLAMVGGTTWIKLGIGSPQWPQAFYPTTQNVTIRSGDLLVARCTYDSSSVDVTVRMGSTHKDEMCNFYLMYHRPIDDVTIGPLTSTLRTSSFATPRAWADPDTCVDVNVASPFWGVPFETDPRELMALSPTAPLSFSTPHAASGGNEAKMTHITLDTYPTPGYFDDLSLASNSKPGLAPQSSFPGTAPLRRPSLPNSRLKAPWIPALESGSFRNARDTTYGDDAPPLRSIYDYGIPLQVSDLASPYDTPYNNPRPSPQGVKDGSVKLQDWPMPMVDKSIGQVGSVAVPPIQESTGPVVYVFHRGPNVWDASSFLGVAYQFRDKGPIQVDTVVKLNTTSGQVVESWGKGIFYLPHGLKIDKSGNMWFTDVALHQVFKYSPLVTGESKNAPPKRLLELGVAFEPGHDATHFCQPTSVAIMDNGDFFVADGYCNSRVIKFSSQGQYIVEWGQPTTPQQAMHLGEGAGFMNIPHSLASARVGGNGDLLFVADRENGRVVCLELSSSDLSGREDRVEKLNRCPILMTSSAQAGRIYAVSYLKDPSYETPSETDSLVTGYLLVLRAGSDSPYERDSVKLASAVLIYALGARGPRAVQPLAVIPLTQVTGQYSLTQAHDMTAQFTADGYLDIYVGNLEPNGKKLWKYSFIDPSFDPNLLITSKKPSVKKAGVPAVTQTTVGPTIAGKGSIFEIDSHNNGSGLLNKMNRARNQLVLKSQRLFASSTLVILLTLGVPIGMTLVIVCLMRRRSRKGAKSGLGSTPLNGHALTPRNRLAESRNRRYIDDDEDDDDAVRSLASTLRKGGHRRGGLGRSTPRDYELGSARSRGRALASRFLSSLSSALRPSHWGDARNRSRSGAAYFNLDAPGSGVGTGRYFGSVFRSSHTAAAPYSSIGDVMTDDDEEEDAVLDLKDYYATSRPNARERHEIRDAPTPRVTIKNSRGRHSSPPTTHSTPATVPQPAVVVGDDDDDDEIEEFSLNRHPRS